VLDLVPVEEDESHSVARAAKGRAGSLDNPRAGRGGSVKKLVTFVPAAMVAALALAAFAGAAPRANPIRIAAKLTAKEEVPPQTVKNPGASGSLTGEIAGSKLTWTLKFTGLTGPTTAANIHLGAAGTSGPIVVRLCGVCYVPLRGTSTLSKALLNDLKAHKLYVNVHTKKNPNGEIRGQLSEG
jgi:hypothetical protein